MIYPVDSGIQLLNNRDLVGDTNRSSCTEKFLLVVLVSNVFAKAAAPIVVPCGPVVGSCYCKIGTSFLLMKQRVCFLNSW